MAKNEKEHRYCGKCIFCNSKCPGCGSLIVSVSFRVTFQYDNETENNISLQRDFGDIELHCQECSDFFESTEFNEDERLHALWKVLDRSLGLPDGLEAKWADGKVSYQSYSDREAAPE